MLEKEDLKNIEHLMDEKIAASENRMMAHMDEKIAASENRMLAHMDEKIAASENRMLAYFESVIVPKFDLLAEGHQTLLQTLAPKDRVEALEGEVSFLKEVIRSLAADVNTLKKAQ